jgi:hypothetical protein
MATTIITARDQRQLVGIEEVHAGYFGNGSLVAAG